jgi:predicted P-loop ATPase
MRTEKGFVANHFNATLFLRGHLSFRGAIGLNVRGQQIWSGRLTPAGPAGLWSDAHTTETCSFMQHEGLPVGPDIVDRAVGVVAHENPINLVGDWLRSQISVWDGEKRIGTWITDYLGAADTKLNRALGPMILIGAAARGIDLGCQSDCVPVFEGGQGTLKTSAVRILGGPFGCENLPDFASKDAILTAAQYWIIEISELTALLRSHVTKINSFISRKKDSVRPPYGRYVIEQLRGCYFFGTCNPLATGYLRDPTGGRRFLPVEVGAIDLKKLQADVGQLWGEAASAYLGGASWWPGPEILEELGEAQSDRYEGDAWEEKVLKAVELLTIPFTIEDVVTHAFPEVLPSRIDRSMEIRIGKILSRRQPPLERDRRMVGGTRVRLYVKPESEEPDPKTKAQE